MALESVAEQEVPMPYSDLDPKPSTKRDILFIVLAALIGVGFAAWLYW